MSDYVVTAKKGTNADLFPDVLKLYVKPPAFVLDMTWGNGVFWSKIPNRTFLHIPASYVGYYIYANDIDPNRGMYHYDFRKLPEDWAGIFDAVVLDPPYLYTGGFRTLKDSIDRGYNNRARAETGIYGVKAVDQMYNDGIKEAYRMLKVGGVLILKCQDQVMSGKQVWAHEIYGHYAEDAGFLKEDLFILMQNGMPTMRHKPEKQKHARKNHSYFIVFRKGKHGR